MLDIKPPEQEPSEHDFTTLNTAVSELSRQTEALLGKAGEKSTKPKLPKHSAKVNHKGKNFDIIHSPKTRTHLKATLKSAPSRPTRSKQLPLSQSEPPELLLPEGEKSTLDTSSDQQTQHPEIQLAHQPGVLRESNSKDVVTQQPADPEVQKSPSSSSDGATEDSTDQATTPSKDMPKPASHEGINFTEPNEDADPETEVKAEASSSRDDTTLEPEKSETDSPDQNEEKIEPADKDVNTDAIGEIYANNLTSANKTRGYTPAENQQKPTVFDTNEYHPELHDWSKLDRSNHTAGFVLALLVVIAGALAYFIISGHKLPFIG